jgi:hypothetical protein
MRTRAATPGNSPAAADSERGTECDGWGDHPLERTPSRTRRGS